MEEELINRWRKAHMEAGWLLFVFFWQRKRYSEVDLAVEFDTLTPFISSY